MPSVDLVSTEIGPVVAPCMVLFARKMLCAWSITSEPPRLAVPRFTNGKRERLVLVNWLLTTTTALARVMNRPGPRRLVKVLESRTRLACTGICEVMLLASPLHGDHRGSICGMLPVLEKWLPRTMTFCTPGPSLSDATPRIRPCPVWPMKMLFSSRPKEDCSKMPRARL